MGETVAPGLKADFTLVIQESGVTKIYDRYINDYDYIDSLDAPDDSDGGSPPLKP